MTTDELLQFLDKVKWFGLRKLYWIFRRRVEWSAEALINAGYIYPTFQQSLIKRPISRKLFEIYNGDCDGHNLNLSQYFLGFGLIHYAFIRNLKPRQVLCVGSRQGFIPAILALACKDNGMGQVDFVDAGYDQDNHEKHWSGIGFWKKTDPAKHFACIGIGDHIKTFVMTTKEYADKFPQKRYQYIYIDGDHSYEGVKLDYSLFWPRLDTNGFMSFHDITEHGYLDKGVFGVYKFWEEVSKKHAISFPIPQSAGLGMLQKV